MEILSAENISTQPKNSNVISKLDLLMTSLSKFYADDKNINTLLPIVQGCSKISLRVLDWFVTNYCKKNNVMYNLADYRKKNEESSATTISFDDYFFVHDNYKSQLKECSKKHFDPFCRRNRVRFYYKPNAYFKTTVGQLNFFKWALENHVIDYIRENLDAVEKDMNDCIVIAPSVPSDKKIEKNTKKRTTSESGGGVGGSTATGGSTAVSATSSASAMAAAAAHVNPIIAELAPKTKSQKKTSSRQKRKELSSSANKSFTKYSIPTTITFD